MSVSYKAVARRKPGGTPDEIKYYAAIVRGKKVDLRTLIEDIAERNTLQTPDVFAVLESFLQMSVRYLSDGRTIDMGQLGYFSATISSHGEETPEEVDRQSIKKLNVNFRGSTLLKKRLLQVDYEKVSNGDLEEEPPVTE